MARLLLVDDDEMNRDMLGRRLELEGYAVTLAEGGRQALALLEQQSFDLVLLDHELSPSQQRNIEKEVKARVIDRTQLILDIFARHARSREGQQGTHFWRVRLLPPFL